MEALLLHGLCRRLRLDPLEVKFLKAVQVQSLDKRICQSGAEATKMTSLA